MTEVDRTKPGSSMWHILNQKWVMPDWLKPYKSLLVADDDEVERFVNSTTNVVVNAPMALMAVEITGKVILLTALHARELLRETFICENCSFQPMGEEYPCPKCGHDPD